jgi:hypothetical protein
MRPATADWIFFPPAKQHHFPGRFSGHHCLAHASLTSGDAFRRITSVLALFSEDGGPSTINQFLLLLRTPYPLSPTTVLYQNKKESQKDSPLV